MTHWTAEAFVESADLFLADLQARVADADGEVDDLMALLAESHDVRPDTVLDVACGIGRHAVAFAEQGLTVEGVDLSDEYVQRARRLAADAGVAGRTAFRQGDMRDLAGGSGTYDLLVNLWTSFGFFDDETNEAVLAGMYDRVAPDGALVLELANREGILADFRSASVSEDNGRRTVESREYDPETSRMRSEVRVYDADTEVFQGKMAFDVRLYAPVELRRLCERVGFADVSLYAGFDGAPLDRESTRLMVVAER